ncbi:aspartate aminotransferase family protein [Bacillus sp. A301a_S52]|nr:aspartate aminotransferase family protein [Bacillus sp. A301a_S52]
MRTFAIKNKIKLDHLSGNGIRFEIDGESYIDAASGTFNLPLGYNHPEMVDALTEQIKKASHASSTYTKPIVENGFSKLLDEAPENINKIFMRDLTGSSANEAAIKMAMKSSGKTGVLSLMLSHHGQTALTTSISGNAFRRESFPSLNYHESLKVPAPYCHRCFYGKTYPDCGLLCAERINDFIEYSTSNQVACMIIEPVMGNGGNIVPPKEYFQLIRKICDENDIILISDEVQTGLGRTGHMFASNHFDMKPNIITLAKGLGGIGIPVAAVLMESRLEVFESYEHSFTSGANLLAISAAQTYLDVLEKENILEQVRKNGELLGEELTELMNQYPFISDVRGLGYMWGLEISDREGHEDPKMTQKIVETSLKNGLILRSSRYGFGNVVKVRPPLITSKADIYEIIEMLKKSLDEVI